MPKPRPAAHQPRTPETTAQDQTVAGNADVAAWLAAALLEDQPEAAAPADGDLSAPADLAEGGDRPDGFAAVTVRAAHSHGAAQLEPGDFAALAADETSTLGPGPEWHLASLDSELLPAAPFHHSDSAFDAFEWGQSHFPTAGAGNSWGEPGPAGDLILLDVTSHARPDGAGKGGGKSGHGGDGGSADPAALSEYLSGDPGGYNILIEFKGTWTSTLQGAFTDAADRLSDIIRGDITDVFFRGKVIDDIRITADLIEIDGPGGILGQAGPTAIRTADYLPATGVMEFDGADADTFFGLGLWDEIVLHEMIHTIGFGTVWDYMGLVAGAGTPNPTFIGTEATLAYQSLFGADDATGVPLEQDGGAGTADSHWDEEIFGAELMTGYLDLAGNYLSGVTVASLTDLGYETAAVAALV